MRWDPFPGVGERAASPRDSGQQKAQRARMWFDTALSDVSWSGPTLPGKPYSDPFNDLELDVVFTDPQGERARVPAFWAGEQIWRVRYSPASQGRYTYRTISSDTANADLHGQTGVSGSVSLCGRQSAARSTARCAWRQTAGTSSTTMARLSSGWATPGGWDCANGCAGRKIFRSWRPTG